MRSFWVCISNFQHSSSNSNARIYTPHSTTAAARLTFFALFALQHRGQEGCGIATCDGGDAFYTHRGMGLVTQVFKEEQMLSLRGHFAIGHTRYSTVGGNSLKNAQPFVIETSHGPLAVVHNGQVRLSSNSFITNLIHISLPAQKH